MLDRQVCKKCRIKELGDNDQAWNRYAETWSDPNFKGRLDYPHIICPGVLIDRYLYDDEFTKIKNQLKEYLDNKLIGEEDSWVTNSLMEAIEGRMNAVVANLMERYTGDPVPFTLNLFGKPEGWTPEGKIPIWCPFKDEHKLKD